MLTLTEIFTISAVHLLTQNKQCLDDYAMCKYRGPNNTMCASGPFIKDEKAVICEGRVVRALDSCVFIDIFSNDEESLNLLMDLQCVHDDNDPEYWSEKLYNVAINHGIINS